jgi:glycosyltransferase involved in cell wall biosynthesis
MKILFTTNLFPPETQGGYELRLFHLIETLKHEHECVVVTSESCGKPTVENSNPIIYRVLEFGVSLPGFAGQIREVYHSQKQAILFSELLDRLNPDWVVHFNLAGISPAIIAVAPLHGIPQAFWYEDTWSKQTPVAKGILHPWFQIQQKTGSGLFSAISPFLRPFLPTGEKLTRNLKLPNKISAQLGLFVSQYQEWKNRGSFIEYLKLSIIKAGIPFEQEAVDFCPQKISFPIQLVYAGALTPDRGFDVLFEALEQMTQSEREQFHLTIAGKAPTRWAQDWWKEFKEQNSLSATWEIIEEAGWLPPKTIGTLLRKMDVLVFPSSRGEGMPLIMQEAMLNGCLILSSGSGGAGELCEDAKIPVFPYNCPRSLKVRLLNYRHNHTDLHTERCRLQQYAREHFDLAITANQLIELLEYPA